MVTYSVGGNPEMQKASIRFGYDRLGRRNTIKAYLPGTNAAWILSLPSPPPVSTLFQTYNDLGEPETEPWSGGSLAGRSVTTVEGNSPWNVGFQRRGMIDYGT